MGAPSQWTDELTQTMLRLLDEGLSTQVVATRIGTTKNAVIGRARRCGWVGRPSPIIRDGRKPKKKSHKKGGGPARSERVARTLLPGRMEVEVSPELIRRLAELSAQFAEREAPPPDTRFQPPKPGTCVWPMWSGRVTHEYCGCASPFGKPYCADHAKVAYTGKVKLDADLAPVIGGQLSSAIRAA